MKLIVENPETSEKREVEVPNLDRDSFTDLETLHYPTEKNPERAVIRNLQNLNISADKKAQLEEKIKIYAQAVLRTSRHIISIGKKIFDSILYIIRLYPNTTAGLVVGAFLASLVSAIPLFGAIIGGLAMVVLPLIGGLSGFKEDLSNNNLIRRFRLEVNDTLVGNTIDKEVQTYKPLNIREQASKKKPQQQFKTGLNRGLAQGAGAMKTMLFNQAESKFGRETAEDLRQLIAETDDISRLLDIGNILVESTSSIEFIQRTSNALD